MSTVAIITARGGSKRIPKKNIKLFCGKPIIEYSIKAALESGIFDEVMVSTDDMEIVEIALKAGASVPFMRGEKTSNDYATTADVLKEVFAAYAAKGINFDYACCIYPTAPFITPEKLKKAEQTLKNTDADAAFPVVNFSFPPQRGLKICDGKLKFMYEEYKNSRSQDLEAIYHDCGQFYFFSVDYFSRTGNIVGDNTAPIITDESEVQDIDNMTDWKIAEMKYKIMMEGK